MTNLTQASRELFRRPADECFETLGDLARHCQSLKERSSQLKEPRTQFQPLLADGHLALGVNGHPPLRMNDWSFSQLCSLARVAKDTVNRLSTRSVARINCTSRGTCPTVLRNFPQGRLTLGSLWPVFGAFSMAFSVRSSNQPALLDGSSRLLRQMAWTVTVR